MNSEKLGWIMSVPGARSQSSAQLSREELETLEDAVHAQLIHVAIGCTRSTAKSILIMIDLSVFLTVKTLAPRMCNKIDRAYTLYHTDSPPINAIGDRSSYAQKNSIPKRSGVTCSMATPGLRDQILPGNGEPVTLRLLFGSADTRAAEARAEQICERFSHWESAETSVKQALSAIQVVIVGDASTRSARERLLYKSASIQKGWQFDILGTSDVMMVDQSAAHLSVPKLPSGITEFCLYTMVDTWKETAQRFNYIDPVDAQEPDGSDPATSIDAADDFVCADTMSSLWYGKKRRLKRN